MKRAKVAIVGGTGFERLFTSPEEIIVGTPYGIPPPLSL